MLSRRQLQGFVMRLSAVNPMTTPPLLNRSNSIAIACGGATKTSGISIIFLTRDGGQLPRGLLFLPRGLLAVPTIQLFQDEPQPRHLSMLQ
jgi:hypothetical protein